MDFDWRTTILLLTGLPSLAAATWAIVLSREPTGSRFLLALITAWVLLTTPYIIGFMGAYDAYPWLTFAPFNTELWLGPLWLLLVIALTQADLPSRWWLWLIPGCIQTLYYTICFISLGDGPSKFAFNDAFHEPYIVPFETIISVGLFAYATYDSAQRLRRYSRRISGEHGNRERVSLDWLGRAWIAIFALALIWTIADLAEALLGKFSYPESFYFYAIVGLILLFVSFDALSRVDRVYLKLDKLPEPEVPSGAPEATNTVDLNSLRDRVRTAGWHLDPDLTLGALARHLGTNRSTLSSWLNQDGDENFASFINSLRVDEVCQRITEASDRPNLLLLAFQSGFGSKATFNRAFKKHTGLTPREWYQARIKHE